MRSQGFRSVFMVASCAAAALGCYLVSLRVASERAMLEQVETRIVLAQRDIRLLQTEIGTRGRLAQLERWNVKVLALSAPSADQFLEGGFALARLARPQRQPEIEAPVVLASAPNQLPEASPDQEPGAAGKPTVPAQLLHQASVKLPAREASPRATEPGPAPATDKVKDQPKVEPAKEAPAPAAKPRQASSETAAAKPRTDTAQAGAAAKKAGDNKTSAAPAPMTKSVTTAKVDPLAPLPEGSGSSKPAKEPGPAR